VLLQHATATAAEHGTRGESTDAQRDGYRLRTAIEEASADDYPHVAGLREELFSGTGEQRLRWQFDALLNGIAATRAPS